MTIALRLTVSVSEPGTFGRHSFPRARFFETLREAERYAARALALGLGPVIAPGAPRSDAVTRRLEGAALAAAQRARLAELRAERARADVPERCRACGCRRSHQDTPLCAACLADPRRWADAVAALVRRGVALPTGAP